MSKNDSNIGANIKEFREKRGLSQEKLANRCGFSNTTLSSYENNRKTPSLSTIATIAKQLNTSIESLYYGNENISFIKLEADKGKKIVNSFYFLWQSGVIMYLNTDSASRNEYGNTYYSIVISKYPMQIKRLLDSLNQFKVNYSTYENPDLYVEMLLASVANEINAEDE